MIELKGIAWNHSRGFVSVVATAQRYEERHPDVRITWEKRSLQAFADASLEDLATAYDLIIMDHPHTALAAKERVLVPLDEHLPEAFLADQAANSVGQSHPSYAFDGHQWTLATDAAAPIATCRPDLMEAHRLDLPDTWEALLDLARSGYVTVSLYPLDALMHLYTVCETLGAAPFQSSDEVAPAEVMETALLKLRELADLCGRECLRRNPIWTAEYMSRTTDKSAAYCPFAYGYSNYSRPGYAPHRLQAVDLVTLNGKPLRSVLGGAGIAVSAKSLHAPIAADYAAFTASPEIQTGLYYDAGGQPGYRAAWTDERINRASSDFFSNTLPTLDRALLRPAYSGYMSFQDAGTPVMRAFLAGQLTAIETINQLNAIYKTSRES
ncbi:MAG: extracellular solute-binding protein [Puniceicoccaceae bacterium]